MLDRSKVLSYLLMLILMGAALSSCRGKEEPKESSANSNGSHAEILFPFDQSNVGGHKETIQVRGSLKRKGQDLNTLVLDLTVNGISVEFTGSDKTLWSVEVPLKKGANTLLATISGLAEPPTIAPMTIHNNYIPEAMAQASDGVDKLYFIDKKGRAIIQSGLDRIENTVIAEVGKLDLSLGCYQFHELAFLNNTTDLYVKCSEAGGVTNNFIKVNIETSEAELVLRDIEFSLSRDFEVIKQHAILSIDEEHFVVLSFIDYKATNFSLLKSNEESSFSSVFHANSENFYVKSILNGEIILNTFKIGNVLRGIESQLSAESTLVVPKIRENDSERFLYSSDFFVSEGRYQFFANNTVYTIDELGLLVEEKEINDGLFLGGSVSPSQIVSQNDNIFLLKGHFGLWRFDLNKYESTRIFELKQHTQNGTIWFDENSNEIVSYDFNVMARSKVNIDFETNKIKSKTSFVHLFHEESYRYNFVHFQDDGTIHLPSFYSWYGDPSDDEVILHILDPKNDSLSPVFTSSEFIDFLGLDGSEVSVRLESSTNTGTDNLIWFSAVVWLTDDRLQQGIYSYNLLSEEFSVVLQEEHEGAVEWQSPDFFNAWSADLGGVLLGSWGHGYLRVLKANGELLEIIPAGDDFSVVDRPIYDEKSKSIYFSVKLWAEKDESGSFGRSYYKVYDLVTKTVKPLFEESEEQFMLGGNLFVFSPKNEVFIFNDGYGYIVIDKYSGDQVYRPIIH